MQDGTKEDGARNSETCFATKKFLTEGLGFLARGAEVELQMHTCFACKFKWRALLTHTGKQKHAAGEHHGATTTRKTHASSQFSMEADYIFQWIFGSVADS